MKNNKKVFLSVMKQTADRSFIGRPVVMDHSKNKAMKRSKLKQETRKAASLYEKGGY